VLQPIAIPKAGKWARFSVSILDRSLPFGVMSFTTSFVDDVEMTVAENSNAWKESGLTLAV